MGFFSNLFGGGGLGKALDPFELIPGVGKDPEASNLAGFKIPEFEEDPDFRETQDFLKSLGIDILGGEIPEFFAPIGEAGGAEFENLLSLVKGDIQTSAEAAGAATGRTGAIPSVVAERTGRAATELRFEDFQRALRGKEFLFREGRGITESVRGAGQTQQAQENQFLLEASGLDLQKRLGLDVQAGQEGEALGKLFEAGLGAAAGFVTGGVPGAVVGAAGGFDFSSLLSGVPSPSKPVGTEEKAKLNLGTIKPFKSLKGSVA